MKKIDKKELLTKQPVIKNVSLFGVTMMISSSVLIPGITTKAYADAANDLSSETSEKVSQEVETKQDSQEEAMTLNTIETVSQVTEEQNQLDLDITLNALRSDNLETIIKVSPNVNLVWDETKNQVKDETGNVVGTYTFDEALNQVKLTFVKGGFTQAKLVIPVSFKKFELTDQTITASIGQSMISKHISTERKIEETSEEKEIESSSSEKEMTSESVTETSTSSTKELETTSSKEQEKQITSTTESSSKASESTTSITKEESKPSIDSSTSTLESKESESTSTTTSKEESKETTTETTKEEPKPSETKESASTKESEVKEEKKEEPKPAMKRAAAAPVMQGPIEPIAPPKPAAFTTRAATPQAQFIEDTAYHAQQVAGANDLYASVMIAQAILESGYGSSTLSSPPNHNLFGVKGSYNGQSVNMQTWEHFDGQNVIINAQFRKYPSYRESFEDNARVLKTTSFSPGVYFYAGAWKSGTNSYQDATQWLTGRYATDPNYNNKLNNLIVTHNLTQYDSPGSGKPNNNSGSNNNNNSSNNNNNNNTSNASTHTVKSGDTLYGISSQYGVSVAQIKSWNNLSSDTIYVGQKLKVKNNGGSTTKPTTPTKPTDNGNTNNNNQSADTYTVKSGDTLYGISLKSGVSVAQIKQWNNLTSDTIYVGQKLKIKNSGGSTTNPPKPTAPNKPIDNGNTSNNNQNTSTYTVKRGDTLYGISLKHGVSVAQIKQWNNLSSDTIYVGQKLKVKSGGGSTAKPKPTTPTNNNSSNTKTHTVKRGDTLYGISLQNGVSVAQIKSWNNLSSDTIYVGQTLTVNGQKSTSANHNNKPAPTKPVASKTHTVQRGDTLYGIGLRYGVNSNDIKKWNNLSSDMIYVGQTLSINSQQSNKSQSSKSTTKGNVSASSHTVQRGDSLYQIALKYNVSVSNLKMVNGLSSDLIYVGQTLKIPGTTKVAKRQSTNKTKRHEVKSGDSLWSLSREYNTSVSQIKTWNKLSSDVIYKGQNLRVG